VQFFAAHQVAATWPLSRCLVPNEPPPPGLTPEELQEYYATTDRSFSNCLLNSVSDHFFPYLVRHHDIAWTLSPELIPPSFRTPTTAPSEPTPDTPSIWKSIQRSIVAKVRSDIVPFLVKAVVFIYNYLYIIIGFIAILFGFYYGYKLIWSEDDGYVPEIEAQSGDGDYDKPHSQALRVNHSHRTIRRAAPVRAQSDIPDLPTNVANTRALFAKAAVKIRHPTVITDAIGIFGSTILMPRHAHSAICFYEKGAETNVAAAKQNKTIRLSECPFRDIQEYELVAVTLPPNFSFRK